MIEFIGFTITLLALVYLAIQQMAQKGRGGEQFESEEESEEERYHREALAALYAAKDEMAEDREELRVVVPPKVKTRRTLSNQYAMHSKIEDRQPHSKVEESKLVSSIDHRYDAPRKTLVSEGLRTDPSENPYAIKEERTQVYVNTLLKKRNLKEIIIFSEIMSKPRGITPFDESR